MVKRDLLKRGNPWELLAIAALIFVPGVIMLVQRQPMIAFPQAYGSSRDPSPRQAIEVISPAAAHIFGALAIVVAALIVLLYFWARRAIARDPAPRVVEHGHRKTI